MNGVLGIKLGMSQMFTKTGEMVPVTLVDTEGCVVVQKKTKEKDGYDAVQLGVGKKSQKRVTKALKKHFENANVMPLRWLREFRGVSAEAYEVGKSVSLDLFKAGDFLDVRGVTKGRGFSGPMKRWGFHGGPAAHGSQFHRRQGSIGNHTYPKHVFKGRKMPGHYGVERMCVLNVECLDVLKDERVLVLKGSVPGAKNGLIEISTSHRKK